MLLHLPPGEKEAKPRFSRKTIIEKKAATTDVNRSWWVTGRRVREFEVMNLHEECSQPKLSHFGFVLFKALLIPDRFHARHRARPLHYGR